MTTTGQPLGHHASDAILGAMRQVALAGGGALSYADTASIRAAAHYLLRRHDLADVAALPPVDPADLVAAVGRAPALAADAVKYLAVMALVDGKLDPHKLRRVLDYARALDVEANYLTELVEAASGHMSWVNADMHRRNLDSLLGQAAAAAVTEAPLEWLMPYGGKGADPALVARYEALGTLPDGSFGKALWSFDKTNGYAFPGEPTALNAAFATPHDAAHVLSGYDTSLRGEILVSTFTAGMHPVNPMSGHILPVLFNGHLGIQLNDTARSGAGALDADEFWHAWALGRGTAIDLFAPEWSVWDWVERDLATVRREVGLPPPRG